MFRYFRVPVPWTELARRTLYEAFSDGCPGLAAQLSFYFVLAVFPALLFLVSLLAYLPVETAVPALMGRLDALLPTEVHGLVRRHIAPLLHGEPGGLITLAVAGAIWSGSSAMMAIIYTLNRAFDIEEWRPWWQTRLIAIALTLSLSLFVIAAFALVVGGADLAASLAAAFGAGKLFEIAWSILQWPVAFALVMLAIELIYYLAPNADTRWTWATPGSLVATSLWLLTSLGFKLYLSYFSNFTVVYGAIGSAIVLLLWFYFSGLAILIGAELNGEIDKAMPTREERPQRPGRRKKIGDAAA